MRIRFEIAGAPAEFRRNWFTGGAVLRVAGEDITLQSVWDPATHYSDSLTQVWRLQVGGHDVVIEKARPLLLAAFRPHSYRVLVDGHTCWVPPPRVPPFSPWRTDTAVALARLMDESRDFSAMPILADALQDAGCDNEEVLSHCRGPGTHVRGCWVVDLVLGKE